LKALLLAAILVGAAFVPAFGQISDRTGLSSRLLVDAGGEEFEVLTTTNFDVSDARFDQDEGVLTIDVRSSIDYNLAEMIIPKALMQGDDMIVFVDGMQNPASVRSNDTIWFITAEFNGTGTHTIEVAGAVPMDELDRGAPADDTAAGQPSEGGGGCLIATAAFGSEMAPQVQLLREVRDDAVLQTRAGASFMAGFNQIYYLFSPTIADWERQNPAFKEAVRTAIAPMLATLAMLSHAGIDSEHEMIGYGTAVIMANLGIYLGPLAGLVCLKRLVLRQQRADQLVGVPGPPKRYVPEDALPVHHDRRGRSLQRELFKRLCGILF